MTSPDVTVLIVSTAVLVFVLFAALLFFVRLAMTWRMRCEQACTTIDVLLREYERIGGEPHGTAA